jgi:hypothetical protein
MSALRRSAAEDHQHQAPAATPSSRSTFALRQVAVKLAVICVPLNELALNEALQPLLDERWACHKTAGQLACDLCHDAVVVQHLHRHQAACNTPATYHDDVYNMNLDHRALALLQRNYAGQPRAPVQSKGLEPPSPRAHLGSKDSVQYTRARIDHVLG